METKCFGVLNTMLHLLKCLESLFLSSSFKVYVLISVILDRSPFANDFYFIILY